MSQDEDGWYQIVYKHTGKAADFTAIISNVPGKTGWTQAKVVTLKANAWLDQLPGALIGHWV